MMQASQPSFHRRQIQLNLADLVDTIAAAPSDATSYLDLETGNLVSVTDEMSQELDAMYDEIPMDVLNGPEYEAAFTRALNERRVPDWESDMLSDAEAAQRGLGTRFLEVPTTETHEAYRDMEAFIDTVEDGVFHERLTHAIQGSGAFRRFKDTVAEDRAAQARWFAFQAERTRERVLEWLESEEIVLIEESGK